MMDTETKKYIWACDNCTAVSETKSESNAHAATGHNMVRLTARGDFASTVRLVNSTAEASLHSNFTAFAILGEFDQELSGIKKVSRRI